MANNKVGFEYYNIDTNRYQDIKIKRLKKDFGTSGIAVYDYILCEVYRVRGCFLAWDKSTAFDVAEYFGLKESLVNEIVNYCGVVGLFDKELLASGSIISSRSIQQRFIDMSTRAKRKNFKIPKEIDIITEQCDIIPEQSPKIPEVSSKEEESKVNNSLSNAQAQDGFPPADIFDKPLDELHAILLRSEIWREDVCRRVFRSGYIDFSIDKFEKYLELYILKLRSEGVKSKSESDAKGHFSNWLIIELKKQKDDERRTNAFKPTANGSARKDVRSEAKAATDMQSSGTPQKDYSSRF